MGGRCHDRRPADWVVRVDAVTGSVIERFNQIRQATGTAKLFVPNAVVANDGYGGLRDRKDHNYTALTKLREPVTLANLDDGQDCLKGDWVNVKRGAKHKKVCKSSLDWSKVKRQRNVFEALMAYFHIDETQQYIQSLDLGLGINAEPQNVVADSFTDDNSFYQPSSDRIELGTGGVDDGEDADVIVHEYGHSVQDAQNPNAFAGVGDSGAMGEGFGDYLAQAYSSEAVGFDAEWSRCVMEWDATSYDDSSTAPPGICLRRTDNDAGLLDSEAIACGGEVHCVGEFWGSALFELRQELGNDGSSRSIMDRSPWPRTSSCHPRRPSSRPPRRCSRPTRTCTRTVTLTTASATTAPRSRPRCRRATCCWSAAAASRREDGEAPEKIGARRSPREGEFRRALRPCFRPFARRCLGVLTGVVSRPNEQPMFRS